MENLKAIYAKNPPVTIPKIFSNREEPLQPDVAYSDMQLTPRGDYEEEGGQFHSNRVSKEGAMKATAVASTGATKETVTLSESKKSENTNELEESDKKGEPTI